MVMVTEKGIGVVTEQEEEEEEGVLINAVSSRTRRGRPISSSKSKTLQQSATTRNKPTNNTSKKPVLSEEEKKALRAQQKREKEIEEKVALVPDLLRNTLSNKYFGNEALVNEELQILHEQQVQLGNQQRVLFRLPTIAPSDDDDDDDDDDLFDTVYKSFAIQAKIAVSDMKYEFLVTQQQAATSATTSPSPLLGCAIEGQIVILRGDLDEHIMLSLVDR